MRENEWGASGQGRAGRGRVYIGQVKVGYRMEWGREELIEVMQGNGGGARW